MPTGSLRLKADDRAANGIFAQQVSVGRSAVVEGNFAIELHALIECRYFFFWVEDLAAGIHADELTNQPTTSSPLYSASNKMFLLVFQTPVKTVNLVGVSTSGYVSYKAGN